jgi:ligand-binding SRPBCC domain-containing protein
MARFKAEIHLPHPPSAVFNFHLDPSNLIALSPPGTQTTILSCRLPLHEGSVIALDVRKWGLSQLWEVEIEQLKTDEVLIDRALKSPFGFWRHTHRFIPEKGGTRLVDEVEFVPPFGPLGYLATGFIRMELKKLFAYRHKKTAERLKRH